MPAMGPFRFLDLPPEIRLNVYDHLTICPDGPIGRLRPEVDARLSKIDASWTHMANQLIYDMAEFANIPLAQTCSLVARELLPTFYNGNVFEISDTKTCKRLLNALVPYQPTLRPTVRLLLEERNNSRAFYNGYNSFADLAEIFSLLKSCRYAGRFDVVVRMHVWADSDLRELFKAQLRQAPRSELLERMDRPGFTISAVFNDISKYLVGDQGCQRLDISDAELKEFDTLIKRVMIAPGPSLQTPAKFLHARSHFYRLTAWVPFLTDTLQKCQDGSLDAAIARHIAQEQEDKGQYLHWLTAAGVVMGIDTRPLFARLQNGY